MRPFNIYSKCKIFWNGFHLPCQTSIAFSINAYLLENIVVSETQFYMISRINVWKALKIGADFHGRTVKNYFELFRNITGKYPHRVSFLSKRKFCKIFQNNFFEGHLQVTVKNTKKLLSKKIHLFLKNLFYSLNNSNK